MSIVQCQQCRGTGTVYLRAKFPPYGSFPGYEREMAVSCPQLACHKGWVDTEAYYASWGIGKEVEA